MDPDPHKSLNPDPGPQLLGHTVQRFIAKSDKSEKPVLLHDSPCLKNLTFQTGDSEILKTVDEP
jgi:hypothetical protein